MDVIPMLYQAITQIKLISLGLSIDLMFERWNIIWLKLRQIYIVLSYSMH